MSSEGIRDLRSGGPGRPIDADVCILGAGPVGLTIARALGERGRRVVVLDIGGSTSTPPDSQGMYFDRRVYGGATSGRAIGLGGTSAIWGGQLLPVRPDDISAREAIHAPSWPFPHSELEPHYELLQTWLGLDTRAFGRDFMKDSSHPLSALDYADWVPRLSKWLRFGKRNIAAAWRSELERCSGLQIWLNAEARGWQFLENGASQQVREITAFSTNGHSLQVHPKRVVIAAGALESARTVLELRDAAPRAAAESPGSGAGGLAGRFLHDHLSVRIARVELIDSARFQDLFAPLFEGATMRSLRMELAPGVLSREKLPGLYAHFVAETSARSGFAVIRDCLRAAQRRSIRELSAAAARMPSALPDIAGLAYQRLAKRRLAFPAASKLFLHVDFEQVPRLENRVYLGEPPPEGRRPMHIDWDMEGDTPRVARRVQILFDRFWKRNGLDKIAALTFIDPGDEAKQWSRNVHDIYHPAGTTRMSEDPANGVVDANLRIHGMANAYVVGSSVFPSMGAANPTFTAMALALRLADFIDQEIRRV